MHSVQTFDASSLVGRLKPVFPVPVSSFLTATFTENVANLFSLVYFLWCCVAFVLGWSSSLSLKLLKRIECPGCAGERGLCTKFCSWSNSFNLSLNSDHWQKLSWKPKTLIMSKRVFVWQRFPCVVLCVESSVCVFKCFKSRFVYPVPSEFAPMKVHEVLIMHNHALGPCVNSVHFVCIQM